MNQRKKGYEIITTDIVWRGICLRLTGPYTKAQEATLTCPATDAEFEADDCVCTDPSNTDEFDGADYGRSFLGLSWEEPWTIIDGLPGAWDEITDLCLEAIAERGPTGPDCED